MTKLCLVLATTLYEKPSKNLKNKTKN